MEKLMCGGVILYRLQCPECEECNLSSNHKFSCNCGNIYSEGFINKYTTVCTKKRGNIIKHRKYLLSKQNNKCYWCNREINLELLKKISGKSKYKLTKLKSHIDHIIPYSFCKNDNISNLCLSCSICNLWKHNKMFDNEIDCKLYLSYR